MDVVLRTFAAIVLALSARGQASAPMTADELVHALREFDAALPATVRSDGRPDPQDQRRRQLFAQIVGLGDRALPALSRGLADPDVRVRRNVALFLGVSSSSSGSSYGGHLDITGCLPALIVAVEDPDDRVRHLAAQAIGNLGTKAAAAVPALMRLLKYADEGSRNTACIGLAGIGPAAVAALPDLRQALSDPMANVRRFAQRAIEKIEAQ